MRDGGSQGLRAYRAACVAVARFEHLARRWEAAVRRANLVLLALGAFCLLVVERYPAVGLSVGVVVVGLLVLNCQVFARRAQMLRHFADNLQHVPLVYYLVLERSFLAVARRDQDDFEAFMAEAQRDQRAFEARLAAPAAF